MSNAIFFNSYKLKKGASVPDFLLAFEKLITEYASKQMGSISFMLLSDGDTWADFGIFETMEDAKNFENPTETNEFAEKFYSFLNFNSCRSRIFSVERSCQHQSIAPTAVTFVSFKLKKGASVPDFLLASDKLDSEGLSVNDATISRKLLVKDSSWADLILWESMEGPKKVAESESTNDAIKEYLAFVGEVTFHQHFSVEQSY